MAIPPIQKITWGTSFANTWWLPGPIDNPLAKTQVRGSWGEVDSGARDFWSIRDDQELTFDARFIPRNAVNIYTGYSDALGVREALAWMEKNQFRFYPDARNLIVQPDLSIDTTPVDGVADGWSKFQNGTMGSAAVYSMESGAQKIISGPSGAAAELAGIIPNPRMTSARVIAGVNYYASIEARFASVTGNVTLRFRREWYDSSGTLLLATILVAGSSPLPSGGGMVRYGVDLGAAPANAAYCAISPQVFSSAGGESITAWFDNPQIEKGSAFSGLYVPTNTTAGYHTCYLLNQPEISREQGGTHYKISGFQIRDVNGTAFTEF